MPMCLVIMCRVHAMKNYARRAELGAEQREAVREGRLLPAPRGAAAMIVSLFHGVTRSPADAVALRLAGKASETRPRVALARRPQVAVTPGFAEKPLK